MNRRILLIGILAAASLAAVAQAVRQHHDLVNLRARQKQLSGQIAEASTWTTSEASLAQPAPSSRPSPELLELRSKVTQLTQRKHQLESVRTENEHLRAQLASRGTNLPPDYIRTSRAQWVGLSTPQNTIQSFLWTLRNHDLTNLFRVITPQSAQQIMRRDRNAPNEFFKSFFFALPGFRIVSQTPHPDGSLYLRLEVIPGQEFPGPLVLRSINGQWRIDLMH